MKNKSESDVSNNEKNDLTGPFVFSLYRCIPFLNGFSSNLPPARMPETIKSASFDRQLLRFNKYQLDSILNFLTFAEIVKVNLSLVVDTSTQIKNTSRMFDEYFDRHDRREPKAALKSKILQHIELGEKMEAQAFKVKYHKSIKQEGPEFQTELERRILVTQFLRLVAHGLQAEAEVLLKKDPTLLMESGVAIDTSGRRFDKVTAIQCSQWNVDAHMSTMLMKYIPEGDEGDAIRDALREQEKARLEQGLTYELCRAKIILTEPTETEKQSVIDRKEYLFIRKDTQIEIGYCDTNNKYQTKTMDAEDEKKNPKIVALMMGYKKPNNILNKTDLNEIKSLMSSLGIKSHQHCEHQCNEAFTSLNQAYTDFDVCYKACETKKQWDELDDYWCSVIGLLQSELPAHALYELTRPDRSFHPTPKFDEDLDETKGKLLPRSNTIYNWNTYKSEDLFPLSRTSSSGLGVDFALFRAWDGRAGGLRWQAEGRPVSRARDSVVDSAAFSALFDARCADIKAIDLALDAGQSPRLGW